MKSTRRISAIVLLLGAISACSSSNSSFRMTDATYIVRRSKQTPVILFRGNQMPQTKLRSVGIIDVVINSLNIDDAGRQAADKGQEIGCWGVFEHEAFSERQSKIGSRRFGDAKIVLVHGGPGGGGGEPAPRTPTPSAGMNSSQSEIIMIRKLYDCVVRVEQALQTQP